MMYVRPADKWVDINVMVYEHDGQLFFVSTKSIQGQQELRVAYSKPYAEKYSLNMLTAGIGVEV